MYNIPRRKEEPALAEQNTEAYNRDTEARGCATINESPLDYFLVRGSVRS